MVFQILSWSAVSSCSDVKVQSSDPVQTHCMYVDPSGRVTIVDLYDALDAVNFPLLMSAVTFVKLFILFFCYG